MDVFGKNSGFLPEKNLFLIIRSLSVCLLTPLQTIYLVVSVQSNISFYNQLQKLQIEIF